MSVPITGELSERRPAPRGSPSPAQTDALAVTSCRFGTIEVARDRIVHFTRPIIGFTAIPAYAVIEDEESTPVFWLQALEAPDVLFAVVDARYVAGSDYGVDVADGVARSLALERAEDARLLCILTLADEARAITANLRAPIVWNPREGTAAQVVLTDSTLPVRQPVCA